MREGVEGEEVTPLPPATQRELEKLLFTEFDKLPAGHLLTDGRVFALAQEAYSLGLLAGRHAAAKQVKNMAQSIARICHEPGASLETKELGRIRCEALDDVVAALLDTTPEEVVAGRHAERERMTDEETNAGPSAPEEEKPEAVRSASPQLRKEF